MAKAIVLITPPSTGRCWILTPISTTICAMPQLADGKLCPRPTGIVAHDIAERTQAEIDYLFYLHH